MSIVTGVDPATAVNNAGTTTSTSSTSDLASEEVFLNLLLTQMQNQDPLDPMDNQEFLSQIAQLSTVEQLRTTNSNLETLQLYQMSINNAQSVSLIGKEVTAAGDSITLEESGDTELSFNLAGEAKTAKVVIYDAEGSVVRTINLNDLEEGENSVTWDGNDRDGNPCTVGEYTFEVTAEDSSGLAVTADTFIVGVVTGITFEEGTPMLQIGSHQVSMGDVFKVNQAE